MKNLLTILAIFATVILTGCQTTGAYYGAPTGTTYTRQSSGYSYGGNFGSGQNSGHYQVSSRSHSHGYAPTGGGTQLKETFRELGFNHAVWRGKNPAEGAAGGAFVGGVVDAFTGIIAATSAPAGRYSHSAPAGGFYGNPGAQAAYHRGVALGQRQQQRRIERAAYEAGRLAGSY